MTVWRLPLTAATLVATVTTRVPTLLGQGLWGPQLRARSSCGSWSAAHEARTDLTMLLGSIFLWVVGAGPLALGATLLRRRPR